MNSQTQRLSPRHLPIPAAVTPAVIACLVLISGVTVTVTADTRTPTDSEREFFSQRFHCAKEAHLDDPSSAEAALHYARAAFEWAEQPMASNERAQIANPAIKVCRQFLNSATHKGEAHYYLALNLGQLAKTKWLGALKIVNEMEKLLLTARSVTPELDNSGPDRALSQLYYQAPRWPTSVGNRNRALTHVQHAITVAPDYPGNRLLYIELLLSKGKKKQAAKQISPTQEVLSNARERLKSSYWMYSWKTWDQTWKTLQAKLASSP